MAEEIKINIGADSSKLQAELQKAQNELKAFEAQLRKSTDVNEITKLQTNIKGLETQIASLKGGMQKLAPVSNTATQSLTNLSRIAQDAPFGFIGIANNINPLVESFQRLQAETGSTKTAFSALIGSLSGPAGIGLAVGVLSSLLVTFGDDLFKSTDATDQFDKSILQLNDDVKNVKTSLDDFVSTANDAQKLNDINIRARFEGTEADVLTRQSNFITISEKLVETENARREATDLANQAFSRFLRSASSEAKDLQGEFGDLTNIPAELISGLSKQDQALINSAKGARKALQDLQAKEEDLRKARELAAAQNRAASTEETRAAAKTKKEQAEKLKDIETIESVLAKLQTKIGDAFAVSVALKTPRQDFIKQEIGFVETAIKKLITDFNLSPDNAIIVRLSTQRSALQKQLTEFKTVSQRSIKQLADDLAKNPALQPQIRPRIVLPPLDQTALSDLADLSEGINNFIGETFNGISVGIGEALGAALSGENIGSFFDNIFKIIGTGLQELGKYFIASAELIKKIKETLALKPGAALIAGIALVALGTLIANQAGNKQAFAVGTRNAPGGIALVGERGPELVSLPGGSQVVPAAQTAAMMGGVGGAIEVFGMLRGQDIYFSNKKYGQTYGRTT